MKNSFACYVLLVLCADAAFAQFIGPQTGQFDLSRQRALSPQQQGHILSDIQQHQHRFNVHQNVLAAPKQFPPAQFAHPQALVSNGGFNPQFPAQSVPQPTVLPQLQNQQFNQIFQNQFINPTNQPVLPSQLPTQSFQNNRQVVQHHTQTSFQPHIQPTNNPGFQGASFPTQTSQIDPEKQKQRLKELKEKQAIIDKHNQFVEKQYEKALKKAQSDHTEFINTQKEHKKKLYQSLYSKPSGYDTIRYTQTNPRYIYPEEADLFKLAVQKYYEEHPTTTTTTTTTPKPTTTTEKLQPTTPTELKEKVNTASSDLNQAFLPTVIPSTKIKSLEDLNNLQKQYKQQQIKKDDLLAQLRLAIGENAGDELSKNITSREISLPNGQKVQIIRTTDPKLIPGAKALDLSSGFPAEFTKSATTAKPPKAILEELTKGVLPPGANFELLKQGSSGLEQVGGLPQNLPNQKKVTFVLLEEQNDGSFKVQGVKGNGKEKSEVDVDSILKKIKDGELKLPPNTKLQSGASSSTTTTTTATPVYSSTFPSKQTTMELIPSISVHPNSVPPSDEIASTPILQTNIGSQFISSSTQGYSSTPIHSTTQRSIEGKKLSDYDGSIRLSSSASNDLIRQASTASTLNQNSIFSSPFPKPTSPTYTTPKQNSVTIFQTTSLPSVAPSESGQDELPDVLKRNGLFAMARFLRQSGLDTILNETGPYTVFAPTDKAFRTLLVQLGGPEKAEEKFRENPRLLSGLLLHHVIPGAFKIESLQDEMTGVSLAGTQLRVNQYNMHDLEWNDIKITTINGAKVMEDKKDIEIPQGIAHSIDRVMFPLPVGDIVQTLQSDRERRFTNFLRALFSAGLAETLQGTKTFTLFAPTDRAFAVLTSEEVTRTISDRTLARELVMRHLTPGTLYTNGMRYYQIRDSLEQNRPITLSKSSGRIKVNNNPIITQNIPATNGVIHALDTLL